ncbi:hypothetical protein GCM10009547_45640 [Sporichthya brevicatena]|uniref:Uncharacterized protein n=1 Tax=Sporichthya brevicatena TaxID=171442 RepID=A0ABN1HB31_9ACTN
MASSRDRRNSHCLPGLTAAQSQQVRSLTRTALAERGFEAVVHADHLVTVDGRQFGLTTLGSLCRRSGSSEHWAEVVGRWVDDLLTNFPTEPVPLTPDQIRAGVHLRLVQLDAEKASWYTHARPVGGGFHEMLVHKDGDYVRWISDRELVGVDVAEMHALGRQRLLEIEPDDVEVLTKRGAVTLCIRGRSGFVASKLLVLPELLREIAPSLGFPDGHLVAVPSRHELVVAPVSPAVDDCLEALELITGFDYAHDHAPISPCVHWWHEGRIHPLFDASVRGRMFFADVPAKFRATLARNRGEGAA